MREVPDIFETLYGKEMGFAVLRIVRDKINGVHYIVVSNSHGGISITPQLDSEGKIICTK